MNKIVDLPPIGELAPDGRGLRAWRPAFDRVGLDVISNDRRLLSISNAGGARATAILNTEAATYLAALLTDNTEAARKPLAAPPPKPGQSSRIAPSMEPETKPLHTRSLVIGVVSGQITALAAVALALWLMGLFE